MTREKSPNRQVPLLKLASRIQSRILAGAARGGLVCLSKQNCSNRQVPLQPGLSRRIQPPAISFDKDPIIQPQPRAYPTQPSSIDSIQPCQPRVKKLWIEREREMQKGTPAGGKLIKTLEKDTFTSTSLEAIISASIQTSASSILSSANH